jgi:oligopeptide transport system permease protein
MATIATAKGQRRALDLTSLDRKQRSLWADAWYRLRRNRGAMAGLFIIIIAALVALTAQWIAPYDPVQQNTPIALSDPVWTGTKYVTEGHPFGTDALGRDILSRLIYGARVSMVVGLVPTFLVFSIGISIGMLSGFKGGWIDNLLMRFTDVIYAFPDLLFLILIVGLLRDTAFGNLLGGLVLIFAALAVVSWVGLARLVRGQVLSLKEKEFIEAARAIGARPGRIMLRHLFPNTLAPIIVALAFSIPGAILGEASLGYLGIGIKPPTPTWGVMINDGFVVFSTSPWPVFLPALCISLVMLAFTFLGDGLRDALDPRMKS